MVSRFILQPWLATSRMKLVSKMECLTSLPKPGPPQAQPPKCTSACLTFGPLHCHLLGASCHFQSKVIPIDLPTSAFAPPVRLLQQPELPYTPKSDLITHLLKQFMASYTLNTVQLPSPCLLTPHRIWTLWTSHHQLTTSSIMPRHKTCQYLEHANFFLPTSPVFTKHKL